MHSTAKNLTIQSFRGINDEITLDLEDFTILYGDNGMGKSSFVNSIEYLFVQKLDFLSKSTIKKSVYINENSSKKDVKIQLNLDDGEYIKLEGTRKSNSSAFDEILENPYVKNASFVVNRNRLLKFIEGTSGDRYKGIMDLLGIKKLDNIQKVLSPSIKSIKQEFEFKVSNYENDLNRLDELKYSLDSDLKSIENIKEFSNSILNDIENSKKQNAEDIEKLSKLMNKNEEEYKKYIDEINELLSANDLDSIDFETDIEKYKRKLYSSSIFNLDNKIEAFANEYEKLDFNIPNQLDDVLEEYENVASDNLKSSTFLIKTLKTSKDYLKFTNSDVCPVCNNNIDSNEIIDEISEKISSINSSNDAYKMWSENVKSLISSVDDETRKYEKLNDMIIEINNLSNNDIKTVNLTILSDLKQCLIDFLDFKKYPSDFGIFDFNEFYESSEFIKLKIQNIKLNEEKEKYLNIINKLTDLDVFKKSDVDVDILNRQIKERENEIARKTQEIQHRKIEGENLERGIIKKESDIKQIEEELDNYDAILEKLEKQLEVAEKTFEIFTATKEEYINNMLSEIRDDIKYFYDYIHNEDEITSPDFVVAGSKKIDVVLDSFGQPVDSRSFASEGHLDTLGLCIFLAFNKHFNDLHLIVLDDVLTTVDETHKDKIARLLLEEFNDYQFIITAHNKEWVDELERLCLDYDKDNVVYEIEDWSLEMGPAISQR